MPMMLIAACHLSHRDDASSLNKSLDTKQLFSPTHPSLDKKQSFSVTHLLFRVIRSNDTKRC